MKFACTGRARIVAIRPGESSHSPSGFIAHLVRPKPSLNLTRYGKRQLDANNAKNVDAWLSTYAPDAKQFGLGGPLLADGHEQIRAPALARFQEPHLHAQLIRRETFGNVVLTTKTSPGLSPKALDALNWSVCMSWRKG